ncbi:MAG: LysM peptidoglycan-binding domain-containing protein [Candidatus Kapaibacterium sp.]
MSEMESKHSDLISKGRELGIDFSEITEQNGKLQLNGTTTFQMQKDAFWDALKAGGAEDEVGADIKVQNTDYYGDYTIQKGDTLSKIAQRYLGDANKYRMIAEENTDTISDPDKINAGATIRLPMAAALH